MDYILYNVNILANKEDLSFLGGGREYSDGIAYVYYNKRHKKVLKILAFDKPGTGDLEALDERLKFIHYLSECGIDIAWPEKNENRRLYDTYMDEKHIFIAYSMNFITDLAEMNSLYWQNHSFLKPYFERRVLDCATFDITNDEAFRLRSSGEVLSEGNLKNPLILLANYTFDNLPQDPLHKSLKTKELLTFLRYTVWDARILKKPWNI
ncbi:MAG: hypothetical protein WCD89_06685 [Anaerocolumna sp.]